MTIILLTGCFRKNIDKSDYENAIPNDKNMTQQEVEQESQDDNSFSGSLDYAILKADGYDDFYSYDDMMADIEYIQKANKETQVVKLCETADGRCVYDIIIGDKKSSNQILIMGAMHAREYITTPLVVELLRWYICDNFSKEFHHSYKDTDIRDLCENVTVHFVPMVNPDGVTISQLGVDGMENEQIKNRIIQMGNFDYKQWKANAEGVDLNRNFDADWDEFVGSVNPASERYKGTYPGCTAETEALIKLTQDYKFKRTISYHTCGALIYWYYKQSGDVLAESQGFAEEIAETTGYIMNNDYTSVDAAGYKDWAVYKLGIPSVTIEVGNENGEGIINPVPETRINDILNCNRDVVYAAVYDLIYKK